MLILEYHPDGVCVADVKTMEYAESLAVFANDDSAIHERKFSQAMIFDAIRVLIVRKVIKHTDIGFKFNETMMYPCEKANLNVWPRGFCDHNEQYLLELLELLD